MTNDIPQPPVAARRPHVFSQHGVEIEDPYFWLRDQSYPKVDDADVLAHLNAENAYFEAQMKPYAPLVETLFQEMKARLKEDESSVPQKDGNYLYWRRFEKGAQYKQWMRKPVAGGADQVILDEAKEADGTSFFGWAKSRSLKTIGSWPGHLTPTGRNGSPSIFEIWRPEKI